MPDAAPLSPREVGIVLDVVRSAYQRHSSCAAEVEDWLRRSRQQIREDRQRLLAVVREEEIFLPVEVPAIAASPQLRARRSRLLRALRNCEDLRRLRERFPSWQRQSETEGSCSG